MKLSGYTLTRNCIELDYCFEETISSLLGVCDEVVVCDAQSTDGTFERLYNLSLEEPKLRIVTYPWKDPVGEGPVWFTSWINFAREHLSHEMQLQLDADEVVHDRSYEAIRNAVEKKEARWCERYNFWRDSTHLAPEGHVCGSSIVRLGPSDLFMPSDEPHPEGEPEIKKIAVHGAPIEIFHYGFIRKKDSFYKKSKVVQEAFFGSCDERLLRAERNDTPFEDEFLFDGKVLKEFSGEHPEVAHKWLLDRNYKL